MERCNSIFFYVPFTNLIKLPFLAHAYDLCVAGDLHPFTKWGWWHIFVKFRELFSTMYRFGNTFFMPTYT